MSRVVDANEPTICNEAGETKLKNRIADVLFGGVKQIIAVVIILFGFILALNTSFGPCGGTILADEPFPAIFICVAGLELILCSYFLVRNLKVESDFRVIIYLVLALLSLNLLSEVFWSGGTGSARSQADLDDHYFSLLRGAAAVVNLVAFYKWAGIKKMITRIW